MTELLNLLSNPAVIILMLLSVNFAFLSHMIGMYLIIRNEERKDK